MEKLNNIKHPQLKESKNSCIVLLQAIQKHVSHGLENITLATYYARDLGLCMARLLTTVLLFEQAEWSTRQDDMVSANRFLDYSARNATHFCHTLSNAADQGNFSNLNDNHL